MSVCVSVCLCVTSHSYLGTYVLTPYVCSDTLSRHWHQPCSDTLSLKSTTLIVARRRARRCSDREWSTSCSRTAPAKFAPIGMKVMYFFAPITNKWNWGALNVRSVGTTTPFQLRTDFSPWLLVSVAASAHLARATRTSLLLESFRLIICIWS